jgi:hypothetical protein
VSNVLTLLLFRSAPVIFVQVMFCFAAWQPQVDRSCDDSFDQMAYHAGQLTQHFCCLEGLWLTLIQAQATVPDDVPLVTLGLYRSLLETSMGVHEIPPPLLNMIHFFLRQSIMIGGAAAFPRVHDAKSRNRTTVQDFVHAFDKDGIFHQYLQYMRKYFRQGGNSLMWLNNLLCERALLQLDGKHEGATTPQPLKVSRTPEDEIPYGYKFAAVAWSWLTDEIGISAEEVPEYFCDVNSSRGLGFLSVTRPEKPDFQRGTDTKFIQYVTSQSIKTMVRTASAAVYHVLLDVRWCSFVRLMYGSHPPVLSRTCSITCPSFATASIA